MPLKRLALSFSAVIALGVLIWISWPTALNVLDVPPIVVEGAEVKQPLSGRSVTAGYIVLRSRTTQPLVLTGVSSPGFGRIEIHTHTMDGGIMRMRKLDNARLPSFGRLTMGPGGMHLMMFDPADGLAPGAPVPLYLEFEGKNQPITIVAPVVAR